MAWLKAQGIPSHPGSQPKPLSSACRGQSICGSTLKQQVRRGARDALGDTLSPRAPWSAPRCTAPEPLRGDWCKAMAGYPHAVKYAHVHVGRGARASPSLSVHVDLSHILVYSVRVTRHGCGLPSGGDTSGVVCACPLTGAVGFPSLTKKTTLAKKRRGSTLPPRLSPPDLSCSHRLVSPLFCSVGLYAAHCKCSFVIATGGAHPAYNP